MHITQQNNPKYQEIAIWTFVLVAFTSFVQKKGKFTTSLDPAELATLASGNVDMNEVLKSVYA